ncbi:MAG: ATP-binding cassette domain-containing protein [Acidobacteria bacterium]|nr:ATP-binding cassette domain-containing protein [Acidobacteriota bacterium]
MSDLRIQAEGISKRYTLVGKRQRYKTLRDQLAETALAPVRLLKSAFRRSDAKADPSANSFWALNDVSFEVRAGEVIGVVGRNGAGKTTLLKILSRITEPTHGHATIHGRVGSLLEVGTGFHPELSGRENIFLNGAILGMRKTEIARKFDEIVSFAEVERFIDTPVKHYSSGMYMRLAFAVAAHLEPEILLVDEVLAVGDAAFQKKCLGKMGEITKEGRTVLFVSHNMGAVRSLCNKGLLLSEGRLVEAGDISKCIENYYRLIGAAATDTSEGSAAHARFGPLLLNETLDNTVAQGEAFEVATTLQVDPNITGFSLYCMLEDMSGSHIFHLREESNEIGWDQSMPAGRYKLSVSLPALWLNPGLYALYFKVFFWGEYGSARHVSDKLMLDVAGTSSATNSVLHPRAQWQCQPVTANAAPRILAKETLA